MTALSSAADGSGSVLTGTALSAGASSVNKLLASLSLSLRAVTAYTCAHERSLVCPQLSANSIGFLDIAGLIRCFALPRLLEAVQLDKVYTGLEV